MASETQAKGEGYVKDTPDDRDKIFIDTLYKDIATSGVHTQAGFLEVKPIDSYDQLNLGSCVANAVALALRYGLEIHSKGKNQDFAPSRLFIWYWAKYLGSEDKKNMGWRKTGGAEGVKIDTGCQIRNAIKGLYLRGCPPEDMWKYPTANITYVDNETEELPSELYTIKDDVAKAAKQYFNVKFQYFRIKSVIENTASKHLDDSADPNATQISRASQIKACIAEGYPVVFGISKKGKKNADGSWTTTWRPYDKDYCVPESVSGGTYVMKEPPKDLEGEWNGGHAMTIIGFNRDVNRDPTLPKSDKIPGAFLIQNSWGKGFSRFWLPYYYFETDWVDDIWVIKIEDHLNDPHGTGDRVN